jgi:putative transposase
MSKPDRNANPANIRAAERTFFVTSRIIEGRALLQTERSAGLFITTLYDYRAQDKYKLHAFVAMPEHFHLLLTVGIQMTVERATQLVKGGFAFRAGRQFGFKAPVWQRGFSEVRVYDSLSFLRHREYIHQNPVRRGLAADPALFPFSSAYPGFDLDPEPQGLKPLLHGALLRHG